MLLRTVAIRPTGNIRMPCVLMALTALSVRSYVSLLAGPRSPTGRAVSRGRPTVRCIVDKAYNRIQRAVYEVFSA